MPRVSQEQARLNRQRVVEVAATLFRERGIHGVGVVDIMASAGLTHGGFYGQFANKDALAAEAFDVALAEEYRGNLDTVVENYLSLGHVRTPGKGCPLAALANDVAREPAGSPVRARFTHGVERLASIVAGLTPRASKERRRQKSLATMATLVGAVVLARAVEDETLANELLMAAKASVASLTSLAPDRSRRAALHLSEHRKMPMREPIVVTGMGVVSPLGCSVDGMWRRLVASESGLRRLPDEIVPDIDAKVAGIVPSKDEDPDGFDPDSLIPVKDRRKMDRFIQFTLVAADQALRQSGWKPVTEAERVRTATVIASGVGGFQTITDAVETVRTRGAPRLSPFTVPAFLVNLAAGHVSIRYGFKGPLGAPVTACAASVQAIGDGMRLIRSGEADVVVCGGAEACITRVALGGFAAARSLSTGFNDTLREASRPFDRRRDGFVMGEGAGILVLETLAHAQARGAVPLAELVGYGTSADAYHLTAGPSDGSGARQAVIAALAMAGLDPSDIGYVNAHATATSVGDAGELAALRSVFGENGPAISSTKSATGHLLGAAGALEAIITVMALRTGILPPTLNLVDPDEAAAGMDLIGPTARHARVDHALSNGFGFGGVNASLVLRRM